MNKFYNYISSLFDSKNIRLIESDDNLDEAMGLLSKSSEIAVDTEFIWRKTYYPELSLIQIADNENIYILDMYKKFNLENLKILFERKNVKKIFHSIRSDISVLKHCLNIQVNNVFDTQIAENIIEPDNINQISYKALIKKYYLREISKKETNSDWSKRPLDQSQIVYAANDVRFLINIMKIQSSIIEKKGLKEDLYKTIKKEKENGEERFFISRLRRLRKNQKNLSNLDEKIFIWRELQAEGKNLPPNNIVKNSFLPKLADVIRKGNFQECMWLIKNDECRESFLSEFK